MNQSRLNTFLAFVFATQATGLALTIFFMSRGDHDMKLLALGAAISQSTALMATASTMLVGRDFSQHRDASDLPQGAQVTTTTAETISTPPVMTPPPTVTIGPSPDATQSPK